MECGDSLKNGDGDEKCENEVGGFIEGANDVLGDGIIKGVEDSCGSDT